MKTIIEFFESWVARLSAIILTGAVVMGGYNWICWSKLTASDWGTWVGAIGTVGTLIGTIWLATAAERKQEREQSARAAVAASALQLRIASALKLVRDVKEGLESDKVQGFHYAKMADLIVSADLWTDDEVLPLMTLRRNVTAELVAARDVLRHCVGLLRSGNPAGFMSPERSPAIEHEAIKHLGQVAASLDVAASECHSFAVRTMRVEY